MPEAETPNNAASAFDVPRHVAIIMDGNGRWAAARGLPRAEGHRRGVEALRRTIRGAGEIGIKIVTIFSFSAENWSRPAAEISAWPFLLRQKPVWFTKTFTSERAFSIWFAQPADHLAVCTWPPCEDRTVANGASGFELVHSVGSLSAPVSCKYLATRV